MTARPTTAPCRSCPYRRDVPSGIWHEEEYAKLAPYDGSIAEQATAGALGVFYCHQKDGRVCAGWAGCHDMDENLALRLAASTGSIEPDDVDAILDYVSPVPLFASGQEAADHGLAKIEAPPADAVKTIRRLAKRMDEPYRKRYDGGNRDEGGTK